MRVLLSEQEQSALLECSLEAFRLYVAGLRPCVDIRTGIIGRGYPISRTVLAINCQYVPPRGSKRPAWRPTLKQVDALLDELERVGLAKRAAAIQEVKKLVLKLPLLVRAVDEQDMNGSVRTRQASDGESRASKGLDDVPGRDEPDMSRQAEPDISEVNKYIHIGREEMNAEPPGAAALLAAAADQLGVRVGGAANPAVLEWAAAGVTVPQLAQAIDRSRAYIAEGEAVSVKYLSKVLRSMREEGKPSAGRAVRSGLRESKGGRDPAWKRVPAPAPGSVVPVSGGVVDGTEGDWLE
ncbi:hypothetical protein [Chromobacterium vaccinii]|uniref:hypothetical protein n=1 Tax=Chromobacterium vaccinii TaxID=1108595 RepID=UPI001184E127|nr:hypothetical protein [Chromobacterium vaccinii]